MRGRKARPSGGGRYLALRVTATRGYGKDDVGRALGLMRGAWGRLSMPDGSAWADGAAAEALLSGASLTVSGKSRRDLWGMSLRDLRAELSYEMRTGEGRRIDDPEFGPRDAESMLRRMARRRRKGR